MLIYSYINQLIENMVSILHMNVQDNILIHLNKNCIKISFPYIYFSCFSFIFCQWLAQIDGGSEYDVSKIVNRDVIIELKKYNNQEIIELYDNNKIDFKFEENYKNTIERIKNIEKTCSISITNIFNLDNIKKIKLMHTNNHPTNYVLKYISIEILKILKIDNVYFNDIKKFLVITI